MVSNMQQSGGNTDNRANAQAGNAILVNSKILSAIRTAVEQGKSDFDRTISDRDLVRNIVDQVYDHLKLHPVYSTLDPGEATYKWFGTDTSRKVQQNEDLLNKGRFVDACLLAYYLPNGGWRKYVRASRRICPQQLTESQKISIEQTAAGIADASAVVSTFTPQTADISKLT